MYNAAAAKTDSAYARMMSDITSGALLMAIERAISAVSKDVTDGLAWKADALASALVAAQNLQTTQQLQQGVNDAYGVDITPLLRAQNIEPMLALARKVNVNLIKSIPSQYFDDLSERVLRGVQQGQRYEDLADDIQSLYDVTDSRAKLIARDQTAKTNAAITQTRQQDLGVTHYRWVTAGDERVRPTHADNEGQIFAWDDPPEETGHPGHDINCRCVAAPLVGYTGDEDSGDGGDNGSDGGD